jgi:hypothetical protein
MDLNIQIGEAESRGDRHWLEKHIAPVLAFQRADEATFADRENFLSNITPGERRDTEIISVDLDGDQAIVKCIVTMSPSGEKYHNMRLFVRQEGEWKLLGWANESAFSGFQAPSTDF